VNSCANGQGQRYSFHFENVLISEAIVQLGEVTETNIVFSPDQLFDEYIDLVLEGEVGHILENLIAGTGLRIMEREGHFVLFKPRQVPRNYTFKGYVEDEETGEQLAGAHVIDLNGAGTTTNEFGFFSLSTSTKRVAFTISYLGYSTDTVRLTASQTPVRITLGKSATLQEVVIFSDANERVESSSLSTEQFVPDQISSAAGLGGQFDLNNKATQSPGVATGADGIGGLNVRGGSDDQNLVLLDGVPVYNPTHAIGILSAFNPSVIREAKLQKGNFSARYAGRLSSVLDVRTRDGNINKWGLTAGIGPLSAHVMVEGPLLKDKISIMVAGRIFVPRSYLEQLSIREKERNNIDGYTRYGFNDLNVKLSARLSPRDRLYFSIYNGRDSYEDHTEQRSFTDESRILEEFDKRLNWGNRSATLRWNHAFGDQIFSNFTLTASRFRLQTLDIYSYTETEFNSGISLERFVSREFKSVIEDIGVKWDIDHALRSGHRLRYGLSLTHHHFKPKSVGIEDEAQFGNFIFDERTLDDALFTDLYVMAWEAGAYIEDRFVVRDKITVEAGLHVSAFNDGDFTYINPQPRLGITYRPAERWTVDVGAAHMVQYLHLLTTSGIGLPTDLWVPASGQIRPQRSNQYTIGAGWTPTKSIRLRTQLFYKSFTDLIEFREGASFLLEEGTVEAGILDAANWEDKVAQGDGKAYGTEWQLELEYPRWNAQANYTLSKSVRQFEEVNYGREFPFRFDRRHQVSVSGVYHINKVLSVTANWMYGSGAPITLAESKFLYPRSPAAFTASGVAILEFGDRNGYRLPAYHRLDLGLSAVWKKPKVEHTINVSIYNAYGRRNMLYVTLIPSEDDETFTSSQFTVLPFIPSVSYQIRL